MSHAGESLESADVGPVVVWPTEAIENAEAERLRLASIIERASESLPGGRLLNSAERIVYELSNREALDLAEFIDAVKEAAGILAEGKPETGAIDG